METALYFPLIRVPKTPWFTQVLLYWDGAASIVPSYLPDKKRVYGGYMSELVAAGLLLRLSPDSTMWENSEGYDDCFLNLLSAQEISPLREDQFNLDHCARVYQAKASRHLFRQLKYRGLASELDGIQWLVEKQTASLYMTYLAGSMCRESDSLFPVTDKAARITGLVPEPDNATSRLRALRYVAITQALPVPSRPLPAAEIRSFKDRHHDKLLRLRRYLDGELVAIASIENNFLRTAKTEAVLQEIGDDVAVLTEKMAKRRWPKIVLVGIGSVVASALSVGTAIAAGGTALSLSLGIGAGIVSVGPAGYQAADLLRSPRFDQRSSLAYAALAQAL